jgi:hypothetical protein
MKEAKLTVRVPRQLLNHAKQYASANNTTLTRLVSEYLRQLVDRSDALVDAPIVRRLSKRGRGDRLSRIPWPKVWRPGCLGRRTVLYDF